MPFADVSFVKEEMEDEDFENYNMQLCQQLESPFAQTFEMLSASMNQSPLAQEYVGMLGELHDSEFFFQTTTIGFDLKELGNKLLFVLSWLKIEWKRFS